MITRIVRLTITESKAESFYDFVKPRIKEIRKFPGCIKVDLYEDNSDTRVYYTISQWESEKDLNEYRKSKLFGTIWPIVKPWFSEKPITYSLNEI